MRITVIALLLCLLLVGCAAAKPAQAEPELTPPQAREPGENMLAREPEQTVFDPSAYLLGFVVKDQSAFESVVAQHAFLRNAENMGYPSKIYTDSKGISQAVKDGCAGVLVQGALSGADYEALQAARCKVVSISDSGSADVTLYNDVADYSTEAARAMGEELIKRKVEGGSVLIIPAAGEEAAAKAFMDAFAKNYPQFTSRMQPGVITEDERMAAVKQIVGLYCMDQAAADDWVKAKDAAEKELKPSQTPKPATTPKPTPKPSVSVSPTPSPTLAPHQAVKNVVIIATDYTIRNLELLQSDGVYAIVARPYFEAAAQGTLMLDRLLRGVQTPEKARLNAPIVKKSGLDKYQSIVNEAQMWMGS